MTKENKKKAASKKSLKKTTDARNKLDDALLTYGDAIVRIEREKKEKGLKTQRKSITKLFGSHFAPANAAMYRQAVSYFSLMWTRIKDKHNLKNDASTPGDIQTYNMVFFRYMALKEEVLLEIFEDIHNNISTQDYDSSSSSSSSLSALSDAEYESSIAYLSVSGQKTLEKMGIDSHQPLNAILGAVRDRFQNKNNNLFAEMLQSSALLKAEIEKREREREGEREKNITS
mmetsp:Transcript_13061/g.13114  ORF Transcript_13061/g.13114 Transcript_13061/m.13114 type:complete len:230 (+) Transcript_13061:149-838(+)